MRLVRKLRDSVLLEDETGYRFYVEKKRYEAGEDIRLYSIPYSLPFDLITGLVGIERELYRAGVHVLRDILNNRRTVLNIMKSTDMTVEHLIELVKGESNG